MGRQAENMSASEPALRSPVISRLLGVYPQKQEGLFMQRIKIPGGRINWHQWRRIAQLSSLYCNGFPLHLTTRQDIELHNIRLEDIAAVHQGLNEAGLAIFGSCGDSVRNITVCCGCDVCADGFDLFDIAVLVRQHLEQHEVVFNLPRKFKISFSGCEKACGMPFINDLGFVAQADGRFRVIGVGSLGSKPALGIELYDDLPTKDVLPLCIAALEFFTQEGDRENRHRARFRHIRERFGEQRFREELDSGFNRLRSKQGWPDFSLPVRGKRDVKLLFRLQPANGNINTEEAVELADAAEPKSTMLRINLEHGLEIYGKEAVELPKGIAGYVNKPIITACPGSVTCPRGLASCWAMADRIRNTFSDKQLSGLRIRISGCPNNCAGSAVGDIGLMGILRKKDDRKVECYRIFKGGGNGRNGRLAEETGIAAAEDVPDVIEDLIK